jgi:protein-arginine kinase activator protein McsA
LTPANPDKLCEVCNSRKAAITAVFVDHPDDDDDYLMSVCEQCEAETRQAAGR